MQVSAHKRFSKGMTLQMAYTWSKFSGIRGDLIDNLHASMFKNFRPTERHTLQFRIESCNALNHVSSPIRTPIP